MEIANQIDRKILPGGDTSKEKEKFCWVYHGNSDIWGVEIEQCG
jgi:hypothetical protein